MGATGAAPSFSVTHLPMTALGRVVELAKLMMTPLTVASPRQPTNGLEAALVLEVNVTFEGTPPKYMVPCFRNNCGGACLDAKVSESSISSLQKWSE